MKYQMNAKCTGVAGESRAKKFAAAEHEGDSPADKVKQAYLAAYIQWKAWKTEGAEKRGSPKKAPKKQEEQVVFQFLNKRFQNT